MDLNAQCKVVWGISPSSAPVLPRLVFRTCGMEKGEEAGQPVPGGEQKMGAGNGGRENPQLYRRYPDSPESK